MLSDFLVRFETQIKRCWQLRSICSNCFTPICFCWRILGAFLEYWYLSWMCLSRVFFRFNLKRTLLIPCCPLSVSIFHKCDNFSITSCRIKNNILEILFRHRNVIFFFKQRVLQVCFSSPGLDKPRKQIDDFWKFFQI